MTREEAIEYLADSVRRHLISWKGWSASNILKRREETGEGYSGLSGIFYNFGSAGTWLGDQRLKGKYGFVLIGNQVAGVHYYISFRDILDVVEDKPKQLRLFEEF